MTDNNSQTYPAGTWRLPPLDTTYLCDDGCYRSLGDLLSGMDPLEVPASDDQLIYLLRLYGVDWTRPVSFDVAQRDEVLWMKWSSWMPVPEMPDYPAQITGEM